MPLSHLFSLSICSGELPLQWKSAFVVPVPKRRVATREDLRPVSLLPIIFKIFEDVILHSMKQDLVALYGKEQFGFRPRSSTLLSHIAITDFATRILEENIAGLLIISFDMSKAFDRLQHEHLMRTLDSANLPRPFLLWCLNFLQHREQRVKIKEFLSTSLPVTSGVPQGSKLAPYLFSCHMSSLKASTTASKIFKYADDVVIVKPARHNTDLDLSLREEIDHLHLWCDKNGLKLNKSKTKVMFVKKSKESFPSTVSFCDEMKILGLVFQNNLKWDRHIDYISRLASQRLFILRRLKKTPNISKTDLVQVYKAIIQSIIEYNCPVFVSLNSKNAKKLETIRNRCHRIICDKDCNCNILDHTEPRRIELSLRTLNKILHTENIIHDLAPKPLPRTQHLCIPYSRTSRRASSFFPCTALLFNNVLSSVDLSVK